MAVLDRFASLAAVEDVSKGLEDRDNLVCGRDIFPVEDPPDSLVDDLPGPWDEGLEGLGQTPGGLIGLVLENRQYRLSLAHRLLDNPDQLPVECSAPNDN